MLQVIFLNLDYIAKTQTFLLNTHKKELRNGEKQQQKKCLQSTNHML